MDGRTFVVCVADVSFPFSRRRDRTSERASGRASGVSTKLVRSGEGVNDKGEGVGRKGIVFPSLASSPPPAPYFSHSLAVSFPPRAFLETPAT